MMATPSIAANAYASLARLTDPSRLDQGRRARPPRGPSFSAMLKEAIGALSKTAHKSDGQSAGRWPPARPTWSTW